MNPTETEQQDQAAHANQSETPLESLASICGVLVVFLFVTTFIFQNFEIPSGSMEKTLLIGDHVLVDRISFAPPTTWAPFVHYRDVHHDDVIVFFKPNSETPGMFLVKRAIGLPGDHLHLNNGTVYRNGVMQNEPFARKPSDDGDPQDAFQPYRDDFPDAPAGPYDQVTALWANEIPNHIQDGSLVVPPGKVFAMGDNRPDSLDSRYWGFAPRANIVGRPLFVYWSFETPADEMDKQTIGDRIAFVGHIVLHFFTQTRWDRTLHLIR
ncbi:signal peptidase I [Edaphobacter acidisoli]|nr:signal peptidase I [Edaphobacter acidisoli]